MPVSASLPTPLKTDAHVLVVDDQDVVARAIAAMVRAKGHTAVICHGVEDAMRAFESQPFDAVLSDVKMGTLGGFDLLKRIHARAPEVPVVLITGEATVTAAMQAVECGAYDYLSKPVRNEVLGKLLERAIQKKRLLASEGTAPRPDPPPASFSDVIGHSPRMLEAFIRVAKAARGDASVLILGEHGTGKERVAWELHEKSDRASKPFVPVNIASITPTLAESELFGHVRGAFTDAREDRAGLFEQAHGGTLFLDEIGDLDMGLQVKLLRAIQERRIRRVGGNTEIEIDIRLVSATNRNLQDMIHEGRFREDLYFRINVLQIALPPVRERREDIPALAEYFLARHAAKARRPVPRIAPDALAALVAYDWPGNVREIDNVIQGALNLATNDRLITADLLQLENRPRRRPGAASSSPAEFVPLSQKMAEYVDEVLESTGHNMTQAAKILGIARRTLQRMAARRREPEDGRDTLSHPDQI